VVVTAGCSKGGCPRYEAAGGVWGGFHDGFLLLKEDVAALHGGGDVFIDFGAIA
jgi:hypothetical protein